MKLAETPMTVAGLIAELQDYPADAEITSAEVKLQTPTRSSQLSYSKRRWMAARAAQDAGKTA